ncbi:cupin domain-containing protein [Immundisolibacter sp.]|uniref:cupin domain-containing protein n=1 Tax=Immundisolibacter sp. TaxID=1934948 RepID=UPI002B14E529|nr:cupin domain-containing protein [Immundisolibacter sp.]MEA3219548.1 hypothetical protein [Immundisolibacter sp.]
MPDPKPPIAVRAADCPPRRRVSAYPDAVVARLEAAFAGREKRALGAVFGLGNFGVNLTRLAPGAISALRHAHTAQDEFIYVLAGCPTLVTDAGETLLEPGMCAGFPAGSGDAHQLVNRSAADVLYLEVGDRMQGDRVIYPDDDLAAELTDTGWPFTHKDGTVY